MSNVRNVALDVLIDIEKKRAYSNLSLHHVIETNELSAQDVALLTELVYGTIQRRDTLDYYLQPFIKGKIEPWVRLLLRMSLYQMVYLDRIPDRAVLFEAVEIAKRRGHRGIASLVNGILRSVQRQGLRSLDNIKDESERLAIATSHPVWLVRRWIEQFGFDETKRMCEANNFPPEQTARVNVMRATVEEVIDRLKEEGIEAIPSSIVPIGIKITKGNAAKTSVFREGLITIQDESSMLVAYALSPNETDVVLDCCAAPGGKTTHIAERMNNRGRVVALDIHDHKVKLIEQQAKRLGLSNIEAKQLDSRQAHTQFATETFDRILVDAPCSGLGVIRRKPEIKYAKNEKDITQLTNVQLNILRAVAPLLKRGGTLVYSTCTVDREENEQVIAQFLAEHPEYDRDETLASRLPSSVASYVDRGMLQLLPHHVYSDGFFIATLKKKGDII
ncbi:16S rRNA (cytosine(967)-C(5))-methyltransferase RsmB [Anoxybacillus sp. LAT_35]|uniref:16S rRNA (cytosine(967)-C(5))-methyltransferase RsmB n=1 Tax=unclassified Anoxybacillus TaxID=2639704 RepID=UPI001EDBB771|nr:MULTISPECIES: 16S rRNA (cytosine(967)-C(5))-methyltransferase RsmB [unclassified Anoxybacillus]MCG5026132.1 16S rRNA (cytosine(967)-C(5))-methyltransferase RsmB [Anoxybacillus flavithermus]MCG3085321.1 16S rRNA (cytosine(967)-C(5))-methyltransferase RsmB [Anoxybacillus sp. LAT27]MCG6172481.1 16S rRNA (cytosine(967)-C(5))-methyltransferase RsmB [Anoxybacillus sp. LAT_11]MCG6175217.1 16S rRNA (cytosine(967)-C(5))-methyltransferase RsmB [Anoxybacillus sp. LAT_31]MCG6177983.1 16S rRNA (cytosine